MYESGELRYSSADQRRGPRELVKRLTFGIPVLNHVAGNCVIVENIQHTLAEPDLLVQALPMRGDTGKEVAQHLPIMGVVCKTFALFEYADQAGRVVLLWMLIRVMK